MSGAARLAEADTWPARSGAAAASIQPADDVAGWQVLCTPHLHTLAHLWPRTNDGSAECTVFQCADLLEVWCDTVGRARGIEPCFVGVLDRHQRPVMLLPLGIERRYGVRVLTFLDGEVVDYNGPVLFPPAPEWDGAAFAALWRRVCNVLPVFDVAVFEKMPQFIGNTANPMLLLGASLESVAGHRRAPALLWKELEPQIPGRVQSRRKFRRLSKIGPVCFEVAQGDRRLNEFLQAMLVQKARRFAETRVPGFEAPGKSAFYREATRRLGKVVHLSALKVDQTIVAVLWGLVHKSILYHLMPGYEGGEWRRYSPGRLHNEALLRWCCDKELAIDFGIGDEAYKNDFCNVTVPLYRAVLPRTTTGRVYLRSLAYLQRLRATSIWQALRPLKWRLIRGLRGDKY